MTGFAAVREFPYPPPAMDYRIQKPQPRCAMTDRQFTAGEPFYSVLIREEGRIVRKDLACDAWQGPPESTLAWWRSTVPTEDSKPTFAPVDVLLDLLEQLDGDLANAPLRYLLALVLVRRRVLKIVAPSEEGGDDLSEPALFVNCRRRGTDYQIRMVDPTADESESVEARLTGLLWAGEAP